MIRIGIDVGGTNTDAVVMDGTRVVAGVKSATTADVMSGVVNALRAVLEASKMEAGADRCGDDRHHALHQRGRAAPRPRADRGRAARPAGDRVAAADGRLAGGSASGDRQPRLSRAWRQRVRRPRRSRRSTKRNCSASPPTSRPRASTPSPSPRCSRRSAAISRSGPARSSPRRCRARTSRCRARSAASACWSARMRRS